MTTYAWHFVGATLRDGRLIPEDGVTLHHDDPVLPCESGLHASLQPFDALKYAPGATLCLVRIDGPIKVHGGDKIVGANRTIIARMDATEMLRYFARMQALSVVHLWDAPDVVLDYLMTGDEPIRAAARAAARDAAWDAAWATARDAAWAAARATARDAAWATAWATARDAAWATARDAPRDAAWATARDAAWATAWATARDAAWATARDAAMDDFNALVAECFEGPLAEIGGKE